MSDFLQPGPLRFDVSPIFDYGGSFPGSKCTWRSMTLWICLALVLVLWQWLESPGPGAVQELPSSAAKVSEQF